MFRLRTTLVLSLLGLGIGIAGTDWLSGRSTDEPLAMPLPVAKRSMLPSPHRAISAAPRAHASRETSRLRRSRADETTGVVLHTEPGDHAPTTTPAPELVPLDMPASRDFAYDRLRGHLDGRVVMRVSIDGSGHVTSASVAESSGDVVLDAHALRSVRGWRFAVPPEYPDGLSADLPMRFSSHDEPIASVP